MSDRPPEAVAPPDPSAVPAWLAGATDAELVVGLQAGELLAFEALFDRHRGLVRRTALGLTGDAGAAEEILQDAFLRLYRHRAALRTDVSPAPWLYRVTQNLCYSRLARRRLPSDPIDDVAAGMRDGAPGPDEQAVRAELRAAIRAGVRALPEKHRSVVVLYYLHGLSLAETAAFLDIRLGTVKSRLHYALASLRVGMADGGSEWTGDPAGPELAPVPRAADR